MSRSCISCYLIALAIIIPSVFPEAQPPAASSGTMLDYDLRIVYNLQRIGDFQGALGYLERLKSKYGDEDSQILSLYKNIYMEAKMYPELESVISKQLDRSPDNPIFLAELGNARFLQDDPESAHSLWALALEKGGTNQAVYIYVANFKLRYGDYDGAVETYLAGRSKFDIPDLFSSELADIYESQRNYPAAVNEYLIRLLKTPNIFLSVSPEILEMVEDSENVDEIINAVKEKIEKNKDADVLYEMLGDIYIKTGQMQKAYDAYMIMGRSKDQHGESLYRFAERCVDFKAYATAINAIDEYISKSANPLRRDKAILLKGIALKNIGRGNDALAILRQLSGAAGDSRIKAEASYLAGEICAGMNLCDEALVAWQNTLAMSRDTDIRTKTIYEMAGCNIKLGSYPAAESLLTIVTGGDNHQPIMAEAIFLLGELALFKGDYGGANKIYRSIVKTYPRGKSANDAIARISVISSAGIDSSGAAADNSLLDLYAGAVEAHMQGKDDDAASILLSEAMASSTIGEQCLFYAGSIYVEKGVKEKAVTALNAYIEKYPEGFFIDRAYLMLGDQYADNPQTSDLAREAYNKILETFQNGPVTELARERLRRLESQDKIG